MEYLIHEPRHGIFTQRKELPRHNRIQVELGLKSYSLRGDRSR